MLPAEASGSIKTIKAVLIPENVDFDVAAGGTTAKLIKAARDIVNLSVKTSA